MWYINLCCLNRPYAAVHRCLPYCILGGKEMKQKLILLLCLAALILSACGTKTETPTPANDEAFALYLVADPQMAGADLAQYDLEELPLAEDPILTTEDIASYNWEFHALNLTDTAYQKLLSIFAMGMPMSGVPFVILSGGERIYAGAFWTPMSSLSFDGVVILQPLDPAGGTLYISLGYPNADQFTGEDPRNDPRLKSALEAAGILED